MEVIKPGIEYKLQNFGSQDGQVIKFTEKVKGNYNPGTTNEEMVNVLVDRFYVLQKSNFSAENQCVILLLKNIRQLLAKRLNRKIERVKRYDESTTDK
jgi:hypothetical protein